MYMCVCVCVRVCIYIYMYIYIYIYTHTHTYKVENLKSHRQYDYSSENGKWQCRIGKINEQKKETIHDDDKRTTCVAARH